ncbi:hypothetical protein BRD04_00165 [Halobacteriales archaeon QS_9_67_17]|nr:MAG: hypothetical protein BRD04_00165 [Halobacteriales archaeon QS_9_67_17]
MLRSVRERGPVGLVPLAWGFATAAHIGVLADRTVLIGHLVMAALLAAFAVLSAREMRTHPVLRAWLAVIVAGFLVTLAGAYGVATGNAGAARFAVAGWMLLPAMALAYTGSVLPRDEQARAYTAGAALSGLGTVLLVANLGPPVVALSVAGFGQTLGIGVAVAEY